MTSRIASVLLVALLVVGAAFGELNSKGGRVAAIDYDVWRLQSSNAVTTAAGQTMNLQAVGTISISAQTNSCVFTAKNGRSFTAIAAGVPITVLDGSLTETITPTSVSVSSGICSVTGTFSNAHSAGVTVKSGDYGLSNAVLNVASAGGGIVYVDNDWRGTTANITGLSSSVIDSTLVVIEDARGSAPHYYALRPSAVTLIAAPAKPTATTTSGSLNNGQYYVKVAYVDAYGGVSLASASSDQTAATTGLVITSPAAATGAVGWLPYITAAGGGSGTEILAKAVIDSTICTLSTKVTVVPACAIGSNATVTAANPSGTSKPVVESTAFSTSAVQPMRGYPVPFVNNYPFGIFVASATLNNSNADVAQFQTPAGYFNFLGRSWRVCMKGATATAVAGSVLVVKLTVSANYAQSPVTLSTITFATQTRAAAGTVQGCWILQTSTLGSSGKFWVQSDGNFVEFLNTTPATQVISADASAAESSAVDLTKPLWFAVNYSETASQNLTVPIVNSVSIHPIQ